jgi:hypothetical protein
VAILSGLSGLGIERLKDKIVSNWGIEGLKDKIYKLKQIEFLQFLNS